MYRDDDLKNDEEVFDESKKIYVVRRVCCREVSSVGYTSLVDSWRRFFGEGNANE